ncbi:single-stranded DNA-binding protein [Curtobacterium flaccumfaciens pv. oortii]|uniref:single-stranded DNA-binding protein n=1 Tax=Curtobacterium flaccumfaciens TaxID=2035 RepID=UPI002658B92F|nr:single-stranded DNA-binding protein [Curtobacterium flaccumfaciens]MCS5524818.1 single-stranded DNA-binding protein [Curtobacterium flaccumfaciens pv. oortii]
MADRTIWGNLAADPVVQDVGKAKVTKFRVVENTGSYRSGKWVKDETPTTHLVEAWFEAGESAVANLRKGTGVVVVGKEHTESWKNGDTTQYNRILRADRFGIIPKLPAKQDEQADDSDSVWERSAPAEQA